jgi:hypothetical protein
VFRISSRLVAVLAASVAIGSACGGSSVDDPFLRPLDAARATRLPSVYPQSHPVQLSSYQTPADGPTPAEPLLPTPAGAPCGPPCEPCAPCCGECIGNWWDNTQFSFGGESFKTFDPEASAGLVGSFNTGFHLFREVRGQFGFSYGVYDFEGRQFFNNSAAEVQGFLTYGVYRRSDVNAGRRVSWGLVNDVLMASEWGALANNLGVTQWRGIVGYATNPWNEFGLWTAIFGTDDEEYFQVSVIRPSQQYNVFWRHNFDFGGQSMLYFGALDGGSNCSWVFGLLGQAPLTDYLGLYGSFVFAQPGDARGRVFGPGNAGAQRQEWDFTFGLTWFVGGKSVSRTVSGQEGLPLLPVANNGSMLLTN